MDLVFQYQYPNELRNRTVLTPHNAIDLTVLTQIYEDHTGHWTARCLRRTYDQPSGAAEAVVVALREAATVAALCRATEPAEVVGKDLGRYAWDNADDRRTAAASCGRMEGWPTCGCLCECGQPAVTADDSGCPVCGECESATVTEDGDVICARKTENFARCHVCDDKIEWGRIETHSPGAANSRSGSCGCGDAWLDEDKGGWGHYSYCVPD
jgi:hypothetical protein